MNFKTVFNILYPGYARDGAQNLVHLIRENWAAQYDATLCDGYVNRPWVADEHAEIGTNPIRNSLVVFVNRPMSKPRSSSPQKAGTAIPHIARCGIRRVADLTAGLHRLVLKQCPSPAAASGRACSAILTAKSAMRSRSALSFNTPTM